MFMSDNPPDLLKWIALTTKPEYVKDSVLAGARAR
jgi:hypothetical protein